MSEKELIKSFSFPCPGSISRSAPDSLRAVLKSSCLYSCSYLTTLQHQPLPQTKPPALQRRKNPYDSGNGFHLFLLNVFLLQKAITQVSSEASNDFYFLTLIQTPPAALPVLFIHSSAFSFPLLCLAWAARHCVMCCPGGIRGEKKQKEAANQQTGVPWQGQYVAELSSRPASSQET